MKKCLLSITLLVFLGCSETGKISRPIQIDAFHYQAKKTIVAGNGIVVSAHPLASRAGVEVMRAGGNAYDAAIATQLALAVVYSNAGNLGGGGFMVSRNARGKTYALDFREKAPAGSSRDMYLDEKGNVVQGKSLNGHLSSGVPGTVAGLFAMKKLSHLPFAQLIQPAIELAANGFAITKSEATSLNYLQKDLFLYNTQPNAFEKNNWKEGDTLKQPELAETLIRIRDKGAKGFYEGKTADLIVAEMNRGKGLITLNDLKNYEAKWRTPQSFTYKGYSIVTMPLPSSGGILLKQMFGMVEDQPLASYGFLTPQSVQLMAEVERRAYADRAQFMGDADYYKVPVQKLTSEAYIKNRMKDYVPGKAGSSALIQPGVFPKESEETTHLSIIDKEGNMVSVTTTLNNSYGSKTVVGGAGFFMNDEMDDFSVKPGVPNLYGAVGGDANAIAPGKRMLSSMSPALVLKDDKPFLVVGTPGGTTITTSVFQTIIDIIDFHLSPEDAVNKPKFHHQWLPDQIDIEKTFPENVRAELVKMGYKLVERNSIGRTELIMAGKEGNFTGIADSRGDDGAEGF